jgi:2-oxoglutarate dehydrogenase E1 component
MQSDPTLLGCLNTDFVESQLEQFLHDPESVEPAWRSYLAGLAKEEARNGATRFGPSFRPGTLFNPSSGAARAGGKRSIDIARLQDRVDQLIRNYRVRGHMIAEVDPLGLPRAGHPELDPSIYGFTEADFDRPFSTTGIEGPSTQTLRGILDRLHNTYCRSIGAQFMHIDQLSVRNWLQRRMEGSENRIALSRDQQIRILTRLTHAVIFEEFVRKKYVGAKTFSLEGAESLIPLLDLAIEKAGEYGVEEIVMAMAHRGRLNVLANILQKRPQEIFWEFEDPDPAAHRGAGDVRYHLGYSNDWRTAAGQKIHLSLCFNPSHLEFINPVALGRVRAKQDRAGDSQHERCMPILIHGDAAFAGEGIVQETLNLSQLPGYTVGGALHVIVNNQIGFTTSPAEARSSGYATDVAKMLQSPIFHVNGEDPEAVAQVVHLAMDFRETFQRDVVIDMYCYRRWGHNEGDEPSFTQPGRYAAIEKRKTVRAGYLEHLLKLGEVTQEEADEIADLCQELLEHEFQLAHDEPYAPRPQSLGGVWRGYKGGEEPEDDRVSTGVDVDRLASLLERIAHAPRGFRVHRKLEKLLDQRREMAAGERPLDWAAAEALALATLAVEGHPIRLSGQDSQRGTFSQRHLVLHDVENDSVYATLQNLEPGQASAEIYNSPLCEAGVLGFDYGYSLDYPEALVLWEAQFGDFWNAAQVIVDQFIASAEDKWRRLSGLVMLLPHGFEGQGPEHSSARIERFLLLAAEHNMQIATPSTPAQYYHLLRRQIVRQWRKPLVVFTPKSLLRHRSVVSSLDELAAGAFRRVLADDEVAARGAADRVLLCSGKLYHDLIERRAELERGDVAIVRIEQLYPLPWREIDAALRPFADGTPVVWVQEEPANMGAWQFMRMHFGEQLFGRFPFSGITRTESASPATGSHGSHQREHADILRQALGEMMNSE